MWLWRVARKGKPGDERIANTEYHEHYATKTQAGLTCVYLHHSTSIIKSQDFKTKMPML